MSAQLAVAPISTARGDSPEVPAIADPLVPPLGDNEQLVALIAKAMNETPSNVRAKLRREELHPGGEIYQELLDRGVPLYKWSDQLAAYYAENDGLLYGSIAWNRMDQKLAMRAWVANTLAQYQSGPQRVLCFGDGPGFDSLHLARCGHEVTYFEVSQMDMKFAQSVFRHADADIAMVEDDAQIPQQAFDAISCMDVLEHVPDPPAMVKSFARWLKPGGLLFVNAPFFLVSPDFPTHLDSNRRFSGSLSLYQKEGFRLVDGSRDWAPLAFSLGAPAANLGSPMCRLAIRAMGCFFMGARLTSAPYGWLAKAYSKSTSRWLQGLEESE